MADTDVLKMKVADLKRELRLRGLQTTGNKTELQERLQAALIDGDLSLEDNGINEDLLDEDGLTDDEEKAVLDSPEDESVLISPPKLSEEDHISGSTLTSSKIQNQQSTTVQSKKVVLKRKTSIPKLGTTTTSSTEQLSTTTVKENSAPLEKIPKLDVHVESNNSTVTADSATADQKKVIKLSEMSMKERLELRAKKFGSSAAASVGGGVGGNINSSTTSASNGDDKEKLQIETLKKRAERFGCVVSTKIAEIEKQEKLIKRQQRFGVTINNSNDSLTKNNTIAAGTGTSSISSAYAEKAKLRLERFKTTPTTTEVATKTK